MSRPAPGSVLARVALVCLMTLVLSPASLSLAQPAVEGRDPGAEAAAARADRVLVERVLEESGVAREPEGPSVTGYLVHLGQRGVQAVSETLLGLLEGAMGVAGGLGVLLKLLIWLAIGCAALWLAWLFVRLWKGRGIDGRPGSPSAPVSPAVPPPERPVAALRAEVEARLAEGRIGEALEALWWWLARSLVGEAADPAWTTRELLARAPLERRRPLGPAARVLDAMIYGPRRPGGREVRDFLDRLEEVLA